MSPASKQLTRLHLLLRLTLGGLACFVVSFLWYVNSERAIDTANTQRLHSFFLADELRQSSDDLTRMVRSYVLTGETRYKQHFLEIMAIRDGKVPRPESYHRVYWDLVLTSSVRPRPTKTAAPLLQLMQLQGFSAAEFAKLAEAKQYSDDLTKIEFQAMQLHEASRTQPALIAMQQNSEAAALLFDARYMAAKAGIMQPIDEFYQLIDQRTEAQVQQAMTAADQARYLFIAIGVWLLYLLLQIRRYFAAVLGTSLPKLYQYISALGSDQRSTALVVPEQAADTVLGWLARTQQRLLQLDEKRQLAQQRLEHLAHYDALTGLANRWFLLQKLEQAMHHRPARLIGLAYLDLDGFKAINDRHGHVLGDQVLLQVAALLTELMRPQDTVARFGGDEFVLLFDGLDHQEHGCRLLQQILLQLALPRQLQDYQLQLSASIGMTFYPQARFPEADQLLRQADQAMYLAKQGGKNRFQCFDAAQEELQQGLARQLEEIRLGLQQQQFVLFYQPKVALQTGEVFGVEALVRWQHPTRGLLAPGQFLPLLEDHALGITLGNWVLHTAVATLALWQQQGLDLHVSVNIAANHLQSTGFEQTVANLLHDRPELAARLELEILESSALNDLALVIQVMNACSKLGVSFALDDFGTGYSSLSYLKQLPLHTLKVDQSFVRDLTIDDDDLPILQGILAIARAFELAIVAEGVETEQHGRKLLQLGYQLGQGYAIARPMPDHQVAAFVRDWQPPVSWRNFTQH